MYYFFAIYYFHFHGRRHHCAPITCGRVRLLPLQFDKESERERKQKLSVQVQFQLQSFIASSSSSCCCCYCCLVYCYLLFHVANAFLLLPRSRCYYDYLFIYANAAVDIGNVAADAALLENENSESGKKDKQRERGNRVKQLALTRLGRINKTILTVWSEHKMYFFIYLSLKKVL